VEPGEVEVSGRAAGGLLFRLCGCMESAPGLAKGGWLDLGLRKEDGVEWELAGVAMIFRPVAPVSILVCRCFKGCVSCRLDADGRIGSRTGGCGSGGLCKLLTRGRLVSEEFGLGTGLHTPDPSCPCYVVTCYPASFSLSTAWPPLERRAREDADHSFQKTHA
jgi:hypothetical protein